MVNYTDLCFWAEFNITRPQKIQIPLPKRIFSLLDPFISYTIGEVRRETRSHSLNTGKPLMSYHASYSAPMEL